MADIKTNGPSYHAQPALEIGITGTAPPPQQLEEKWAYHQHVFSGDARSSMLGVTPPPVAQSGLPPVVKGGRKWEPGFFARLPWLGFGALGLSLCCTVAAVAILVASNGKLVVEWSGNTQPGVLLAYTSTLANALLSVAFAEGMVINFWTGALRGVPISYLHHNWAGGTSAFGALKAIFRGQAIVVSVACVFVTITSLLRGPLTQRASFVETRPFVFDTGEILLPILPNTTDGWAGITAGRSGQELTFSPGFANVTRGFQSRSPISILAARCDNCSVVVESFGFGVNCTRSKVDFDLSDVDNIAKGKAWLGTNIFESGVVGDGDNIASVLRVSVLRKTTSDCGPGQLDMQVCDLRPSVVKYNLTLDRGNLTFKSSSWRSDSVVKRLDMGLIKSSGNLNTMAPLRLFGSALYNSSSFMHFGGATSYTIGNVGILANTYMNRAGGSCQTVFADPMDDIINSYREIALRMSVAEGAEHDADGRPVRQAVPFMSDATRVQYAVDWRNMAVAVAVSLLGPLTTLLLFWGWWNLGRPFSLSPLELVNAFHPGPGSAAGIVAASHGNAEADELVKLLREGGAAGQGDPAVWYGVVGGTNRLGMGVAGENGVRRPKAGEVL